MITCRDNSALIRLHAAKQIWWFFDYDGTLADFAPNPDVILPDPELIHLVTQLAARDDMRVTIISGRRLAHIEQLLPVNGLIKAGSYGLELRLPTGELLHPVAQDDVRPVLDLLKAQWESLLDGRKGFYLEDKGWTLAIHAKDADVQEGKWVIDHARLLAEVAVAAEDDHTFKLLGGDRFFEIAPQAADKRRTVKRIIKSYAWPGAMPVYLGDDDKDALAFDVVQAYGGIAVAVGNRPATNGADCRLSAPADCRRWLKSFY